MSHVPSSQDNHPVEPLVKIIQTIIPLAMVALLALIAPACEEHYSVSIESSADAESPSDDQRIFFGAYLGEDCTKTSDCRDGLICDDEGECSPSETKQADEKCLMTLECDPTPNFEKDALGKAIAPHGLHCGWAGFCVKSCVGCPYCGDGICNGEETSECPDCNPGQVGADCQDLSVSTADISIGTTAGPSCSADAGQEGSDCSTSSECDRKYFCDMQGLSGFCTRPEIPAGKGDIGNSCESTKQCHLGLRCSENTGKCVPGSILLYPDLFGGEDCSGTQAIEAVMPFGVRMAIPDEDYLLEEPVTCSEDAICADGTTCCGEDTVRANSCAVESLCDTERERSNHLDYFGFPFPNDGLHTFKEDIPCGTSAVPVETPLACAEDVECGGGDICCGEDTERAGTCSAESACDEVRELAEEDQFDECIRDLRAAEGSVKLQGFPVPGNGLIGFDPIGATLNALDGEVVGWSLLQATTLRFTRALDEASLEGNVFMVNLNTGALHPSTYKSEALRNKFSCANRLFVQPLLSHPLEPNTPYAVIVNSNVRSLASSETEAGESPQQLEAMAMLLGNVPPSPGVARDIYESFAPLRDKLGQGSVPSRGDIMGATVFTTGHPSAAVDDVRTLVDSLPAPEVVWSVRCDEGVQSRCATPRDPSGSGDGETDARACPAANDLYTEYHTLVEIPVIQTGERPYVDVDAENPLSGDLNYVDGELAQYTTEQVCVSISVPKIVLDEATGMPIENPTAEFPVLLYGHGTGGTHRQGIALLGGELASPVQIKTAQAGVAAAQKEQFIVVAWDQPMHHLRRFPSDAVESWNVDEFTLAADYIEEYSKEPGPLFYNFQNPRAARANYLQAVADTFSLVKLIKEGDLSSIGGDAIPVDTDRVAYHGHSQGGGNGPMVAPFEPGLDTMVLSGTGGGTVDGILGKKLPYDSSIGCRIMLQEIDVSRSHPGIQVLQHYFDAIDPSIYAPLLTDPPSERLINFMEVIGVRDSFTPPVSMAAYARGADLALLSPASGLPVWFDLLEEGQSNYFAEKGGSFVSGAVRANRPFDAPSVTHVSVQHPPCANDAGCSGGVPTLPVFDGHFVVYQNEDALREALSFLYSWAETGEAVVSPSGSNLL